MTGTLTHRGNSHEAYYSGHPRAFTFDDAWTGEVAAQPGSTPTLESSNVQPAAFAGIKTSDIAQPEPPFQFRPVHDTCAGVFGGVDREHILAADVRRIVLCV